MEEMISRVLGRLVQEVCKTNQGEILNLTPFIQDIVALFPGPNVRLDVVGEYTFQQDIRNLIVAMGMMSENLFRAKADLPPVYRDGDFHARAEMKK